MNYFSFALARMAGFLIVGLIVLMIEMTGARFAQSKLRARYEQLGAAVSDEGRYQMSWFLWPPHFRILGTFNGRPFKYEVQKPPVSHVYLECMPLKDVEFDARPGRQRLRGALAFPQKMPHWDVLLTTRSSVPFWRMSADRRPSGFGSHPGVDLHRSGALDFDPGVLRTDLEQMGRYCSS